MTYQNAEKAYVHWMYQAAGMGGRKVLEALEKTGTPEEIYKLAVKGKLRERLAGKYGRKAERMEAEACSCSVHDIQEAYRKMTDRGISFVTLREQEYPKRLAAVPDAPYGLYYVGRLPEEGKKSIAVIGARNCSEYGRVMAGQFARTLAAAGVQVVSGMARGIDGIGQQAALDAGGYSLGVLGCGVDVCYPPENERLYGQLIEKGGICSEYPPGIAPRAMLFPPRNRIISGMCDGVLVVEAKERSGTLITVDMALEQGREVYALPGRVTDPLSRGCNELIRQGAELVESPQKFLQSLDTGFDGQISYSQMELPILDSVQGKLLQLLDFQPLSMEALRQAYRDTYGTYMTVPELCHGLLQLCAMDYAGQVGGNYYFRKGK